MSPCTLLVEREMAMTLPESCLAGTSSGIKSSKLVSSRLNAVVCELAMLPETFSSAKDCARRPVTAVVNAPKIPITLSHFTTGPENAARVAGHTTTAAGVARPKPSGKIRYIRYLDRDYAAASGQDRPHAGKNCR